MTNPQLDSRDIAQITVTKEQDTVDGIPRGKRMTRDKWMQIQEVLEGFHRAIRGKSEEDQHCMVVAGYLGPVLWGPETSTEDRVVQSCRRHFNDRYPMEVQRETIHVVLDSGGGSLDSAFKTVLYLRRFANDIRVYVPRRAKSAGTLIAIGADQIVMSPYAELGPLDSRVYDPRNPKVDISALDLFQSVDYVRKFGVDTLIYVLRQLHGETQARLPLQQLIEEASHFALGGVLPMLEQVKALDFGSWGRNLKIGETYAKSLLATRRSKDLKGEPDRTAKKLVYEYTHHPYPIDIDEADRLGLNPMMMPREVYDAAIHVVRECDDVNFVGFAGAKEDEQEFPIENDLQPYRDPARTAMSVRTIDPPTSSADEE